MSSANSSKERALVLGGGGAVGIAWEVGVIAGLAQAGVNLMGPHNTGTGSHTPDVIIGTSAGSIVGAMLSTHSISDLLELSTSDSSSQVIEEVIPLLDFMVMAEAFAEWQKISPGSPASLARVCALAAQTKSISEDRWIASVAEHVKPGWPDPRFRCAAVDTANGARVVWDSNSGVDIAQALASSCSVPAVFPSVTITANGYTSRYTDGGVHSGTSIDLAAGYDKVLVLAPIGSWAGDSLDALAAEGVRTESATTEAAGSRVISMFTDDQTNQATLGSPLGRMDPASRQPAVDHGVRQGRQLAEQLHGWW